MEYVFRYSAGNGENVGGEVSVCLSNEESNLIERHRSEEPCNLAECKDLDGISSRVMEEIKKQEVNIYRDDEDLLEWLFDGDEISRDEETIWSRLTDQFCYTIKYPKA